MRNLSFRGGARLPPHREVIPACGRDNRATLDEPRAVFLDS